MKVNALIADDESLARERLRYLLATDLDVEIAGECRNGREVVEFLQAKPVDVLFLDIQMPGLNGFDALDELENAQLPAIVFVTAHKNYAVQAFEVHALDYLTKPVELERMRATLVRIKERIASKAALLTHLQLKTALSTLTEAGVQSARGEYPKRLLVQNGTKTLLVNVEQIDWIEAADYYSCLHVGTKEYLLRETIKALAATLDPDRFVRIHRSVIVNVDQVREIVRDGQTEGSVVLQDGQRLRMSKLGWQSLLAVSHK